MISMKESFERQSGLVRVEKGTPEQKQVVVNTFENRLHNQEFSPYERKKNTTEQELINDILRHLPNFIARHGGSTVSGLSTDNVHFIDPEKMPSDMRERYKDIGGLYNFPAQAAVVTPSSD